MKVFQVTLPYFDGDHDHGVWQSPLFSKREDAECFKNAVTGDWGTFSWSDDPEEQEPTINEIEVVDSWNGELPKDSHDLLTIH
jgi:hypothetical protein